ncbi:hypothetical protein SAMN06265348_109314 [Pedobacter westerhofensis]|uniref:Uncharacterized protein n=1 Tax=Pedobacter westerhofensis TaxID=425512 RepID=A0A521F005_9SPHI|nr:hypothetical protein [Pedobacter westerhofensis]SMO89031.1 hypothetical protein SAMN06265348_109314 [Pedobacter westerhofensis]
MLFRGINEENILITSICGGILSLTNFGAEDDLNEPFIRLLMLVKTVNEENVLVKEGLHFEGV